VYFITFRKMQKPRIWHVRVLAVAIILLIAVSSVNALQVCEYASKEHGCEVNPLTWFPCFVRILMDVGNCVMMFFISKMTDYILMNPDISAFKPFINDIISILFPMYVVAIVVTGIFIIFLSTDPEHRARAKSMLIRLILGMAMVTTSMQIYEFLMNLAQAIAAKILAGWVIAGGGGGLAVMTILIAAAAIFWYISVFILPALALIALISLVSRYLLVCLMAILFPLTLFFYFFEFTKGIGTNMMRYTMMAIFAQPVQALMMVIMIISLQSVESDGGGLIALVIGIVGLVMIIAAPLIMFGLMNWIGGAVAGAGMMVGFKRPLLGAALTAVGGVGSGMGPEALVAGGSIYVLGKAYTTRMEKAYPGMSKRRHPIVGFVKATAAPPAAWVATKGKAVGKAAAAWVKVKGARPAAWVGSRGVRGRTIGGALNWTHRNVGLRLRDFGGKVHEFGKDLYYLDYTHHGGMTITQFGRKYKSLFLPGYLPAKAAARAAGPVGRSVARGARWTGRRFTGPSWSARSFLMRYPTGRSIVTGLGHARVRVGGHARRAGQSISHTVTGRVIPAAVRVGRWTGRRFTGPSWSMRSFLARTPRGRSLVTGLGHARVRVGGYVRTHRRIWYHGARRAGWTIRSGARDRSRRAKRWAWTYKRSIAYNVGMSLFMPGYAAHLAGRGVTRGLYEAMTTARAQLSLSGINNIQYRDAERYKKLRDEMRTGGVDETEARMLINEAEIKSEADFNDLKDNAKALVLENKFRDKHYRKFSREFFKPFKPSKTIDGAIERARKYGVPEPTLANINASIARSRAAVEQINKEIRIAKMTGNRASVRTLNRKKENYLEIVNRRINNAIIDSGGFADHVTGTGKKYKLLNREIRDINSHFRASRGREIRKRPLENANRELNEALRNMYGPTAPIEHGNTINEIRTLGSGWGLTPATLNQIENNYNSMRSSLPTTSAMNRINSKALRTVNKATAGVVGADVDKSKAKYCQMLNSKFTKPLEGSETLEDALKRGRTYGADDAFINNVETDYNAQIAAGVSPQDALETANIQIDNEVINSGGFEQNLRKMGKKYGLLDGEINTIHNEFMGVRQLEMQDFVRTQHRIPTEVEWNKINAEALVNTHRSVSEVVGAEGCNEMSHDEHLSYSQLGLSPDEYKRRLELGFALDLGSNLHARMILEDYLGFGPRPSEFYHGAGPETKEEREKEREREEKMPLYEAATTESETVGEIVLGGMDKLRKPPEKKEGE
jgi:hypothetical protein